MANKSSHVSCAFAVRMSTQPLMDTQHTVLPEVKYTPHHSLQSNDPAGRSWGWRSDEGPESGRERKRNLTLRNRDKGWEAGLEREGLPLTQQLVKSAHRPAMRSLQGVPVSNSCVRIKTTLGQREEISEKLSSVHSKILFICSTFTQSTITHLITTPTPRKRWVSAAMFTSYTRSQSAAEKTALSAPRPSALENMVAA